MKLLSVVLCALLSACGGHSSPGPTPTPTPVVTIPDVTAYLAQWRCPDGSLPLVTHCPGAVPQKASDPQFWRRADWGDPAPPAYYQISGSVVADDGASFVSIWSYPPFGPFVAAYGDGGEVYKTDGATVLIDRTQDGGYPGMQYFVGPACGATGWIAFRNDAPNSVVATLSDQPAPSICPGGFSSAWTRYYTATAALPFVVFGAPQTVTVPVVVSDHCNSGDPATCTALERTFFGLGWGRLYWAAWGPAPATIDLSARCPAIPLDTPPFPNWHLQDCRLTTNIITADGSLSIDGYGWP